MLLVLATAVLGVTAASGIAVQAQLRHLTDTRSSVAQDLDDLAIEAERIDFATSAR